jgi:hypothetical protein
LNAGEAAQTQCLALKGDTPLNFTWTFHGDEATFHSGVVTTGVGQRGSALIIDSVTTHHAGTYTCTARNQVASASYSAVLSVSGTNVLRKSAVSLDIPPETSINIRSAFLVVSSCSFKKNFIPSHSGSRNCSVRVC